MRERRVSTAAMSVASDPKTISIMPYPPKKFAKMHPMRSPGTASGIYRGRRVNASETLNCTGPYDIGASIIVSAAYSAAMSAHLANLVVMIIRSLL